MFIGGYMRFRPYRGSLAESLALAVEVDGRAGLIAYIRTALRPSYMNDSFPDHAVNLQSYFGDDDRTGWRDVHIVILGGYGVIGFCEGRE
jgi:hypothetical protein